MRISMLLLIIGAGAATYLTRFPLMIISGRKEISPKVAKLMSFIAPAVLTSLIAPAIFIKEGSIDLSLSNSYIIAAAITALIAYYSKNMLVTVITGIATVAVLMYIL